ncbi:MAG: hypothetical protein WBF53_12310 [Litorimonas sp.]
MNKFKITAALAALSFAFAPAAFAQDLTTEQEAELMKTPSTEGIVTDRASCEYEGGSVETLSDGTVCFIPIRGVAANTQIYDGMKLGVIRCEGNGAFPNEVVQPSGAYCRVYLTAKAAPKTREELQRELDAMTEAELDASN